MTKKKTNHKKKTNPASDFADLLMDAPTSYSDNLSDKTDFSNQANPSSHTDPSKHTHTSSHTNPSDPTEILGDPDSSEYDISDALSNPSKNTSSLSAIFKSELNNNTPLPAEHPLNQSEHLHIAQQRISELEKSIDSLREENEQLLISSETIETHNEELKARLNALETDYKENLDILKQETILLKTSLNSKNEDILKLKHKNQELQRRLNTDFKHVRVRERELENRLEILKMEGSAVVRNKDETILDLKRKVDQLTHQIDNYRTKNKEFNESIEEQQNKVKKAVKGLRLVLSLLESGHEGETSNYSPAIVKNIK